MPTVTSPSTTKDLDAQAFAELARQKLFAAPPKSTGNNLSSGDDDLNPDVTGLIDGLRPAAVLVGIVDRAPLSVLLTERTPHLSAHAGQIAFPGGKIEATDPSALAAALRESEEEIGLASQFIEPLGYLEPYRTGTGFSIDPVVALIHPGFIVKPDPSEVADVFEVPLGFLMDVANHRIDSRNWRGAERRFYAMPYEERYIWGATAGIIRALYRRLFTA